MDQGHLYIEIESAQSAKKSASPCGDMISSDRNASSTTLIVCDGIGSGIKANIAAALCVSRLEGLLGQGYSLRKAFASVVNTMEAARGTDMPYAVFTVARILNDGVATVLSYEMPAPILVSKRYANILPQRTITIGNSMVGEATCHVATGEGILVVSDGITQAGLGNGYPRGWTSEGLNHYVNDCLSSGIPVIDIPKVVLQKARDLWGKKQGDDCTAVIATCRKGKTVNILTGPPKNKGKDASIIKHFLSLEGTKVVSGGTTAKIVADQIGKELQVEPDPQSLLAPASYMIEGIDLVTEGAITLNQVYNVFDEDPSRFDEISGVTQLHELLQSADRVNIIMGCAINPATQDISFRQKGILTRQVIIPLIVEKLQAAGKLVVLEKV